MGHEYEAQKKTGNPPIKFELDLTDKHIDRIEKEYDKEKYLRDFHINTYRALRKQTK